MPFFIKIRKKIVQYNALQAHLKKRVLPLLLQKKKGSMTVEAAFALPFFLFFIINMMSMILIFGEYTRNLSELHQQAKELSIYEHLTDNANEMVVMTKVQELKPTFSIIAFPGSSTIVNCRVRKWTGYNVNHVDASNLKEELVYITETGRVYHRSRGCSYLNPSIRCTTIQSIQNLRNHDGAKYKPCSNCGACGGLGIVYITEYGERYHYNIRCSGLKRTIRTVPLSKVKHLGSCSKCG